MTEALYLSDSKKLTSDATILTIGDNYLILDQTVFYPQGGGQPSDKGIIQSKHASLNVKSVEYNGGEIKHIGIIKGTFKVGDKVRLEVDEKLRIRHTQWHTAGHLLDLVVRQLNPKLIPIRGMHGIGKKFYIEYEGIHQLDLELISREIDKLVSLPPAIKTHFVTLEELKQVANWLPKNLPSSKKLRVLSIGDSYHIPDGGTQLTSKDQVWKITITQLEHTEKSTIINYQVLEPKAQIVKANVENKTSTIVETDLNQRIESLNKTFLTTISNITDPKSLDAVYIEYLGKKGILSELMAIIPTLSVEEKKKYGPLLNQVKNSLEEKIEAKRSKISSATSSNHYDLTIPGEIANTGHLHPTTTIIREMNEFFRYLGFSIGEGPELEDVEYNFRRLNLPEGHPATDLQDSLFIKEPQYLMRTHTSSVETRILSEYHDKLPLRVVVPGKCYRNETNSATNTSFFYQYQGFVVDRGITIQHLKDTLTKFHQFLFGDDVKLRFRYKYYPEVSPGMGVDMQCRFCQGSGCSVCKYRGFIEVLGSGMIHYNTMKACGIDPEIYTGYAFGMGLDRLVMSKYGIKDIRKLYGGEIVYV